MTPEPKFKFNDAVKITNGFYKGYTGRVWKCYWSDGFLWCGAHWQYQIFFDEPALKDRDFWAEEKQLEDYSYDEEDNT